jgi:hypothetical protein
VTEPDGERRDRTAILLAVLVGALILLGVVWDFSANRGPDQDKLINPQLEQSAQSDSSKICSAKEVYASIKQQLFQRAAQVRGRDQDVFAKLTGSAVLRMENPVMESEDSATRVVKCSGTMTIELPSGFAVAAGPGTLSADVDYAVQLPGDAGALSVEVRNADAVIASLATVQENVEATTTDGNVVEKNGAAPVATGVESAPATEPAAKPSFDCARAGTQGEAMVCSDPRLARLDAAMAMQYRRAMAVASPEQTQLLQTSRSRFLAYRDHCPDRACVANAYVGRMREIGDIMEGRLDR